MSPLLIGEDLALIRGGRLLFERLDISLSQGEAIHVTGPNGSGKSSLIRLIAGLLKPCFGRIVRAGPANLTRWTSTAGHPNTPGWPRLKDRRLPGRSGDHT